MCDSNAAPLVLASLDSVHTCTTEGDLSYLEVGMGDPFVSFVS